MLEDRLRGILDEDVYEIEGVAFGTRRGAGAVGDSSNVDYLGMVVMMKPSTFLALAAPMVDKPKTPVGMFERMIRDGKPLGVPFLGIDLPQRRSSALVRQHESRTRMLAIMAVAGDVPVPVHVFPNGGFRSRHLNDSTVDALRDGMRWETTRKWVEGPLFGTALVAGRLCAYEGDMPISSTPLQIGRKLVAVVTGFRSDDGIELPPDPGTVRGMQPDARQKDHPDCK